MMGENRVKPEGKIEFERIVEKSGLLRKAKEILWEWYTSKADSL